MKYNELKFFFPPNFGFAASVEDRGCHDCLQSHLRSRQSHYRHHLGHGLGQNCTLAGSQTTVIIITIIEILIFLNFHGCNMIVALKRSKVEAWRRTVQEPSRKRLAGTWSPGWRRSGFDLELSDLYRT